MGAAGDEVDGRVRRGQESREARRAQIKESALQVFAEQGYHATSVTDLVKAAGVARGTFYLYFDSKDALFLELLDDLLVHLRSNVVGVDLSPGAEPMEAQLQATVVRILRTVASNRPLTRIIFREAVGLHDEVDERLRTFDTQLHDFVAGSLRLGVELGVLRLHDVEVGATCVIGSLRELIYRELVVSEADVDPVPVARALLDYHLRGLLPR
jgi:AcrR family transcriptional regulator